MPLTVKQTQKESTISIISKGDYYNINAYSCC